MVTFDFNGRELPFLFTLDAWERMEKEVCTMDELFDMYRGQDNAKRMLVDTMHKTLKLAVILSEAADAKPPITYDELHNGLIPGEVILLQGAIMNAVSDGLDFENKKKPGPRDLVLEEIEPKKP